MKLAVSEINDWWDFELWLENYWSEHTDEADSILELVLRPPSAEVVAAIERVDEVIPATIFSKIWSDNNAH